MAFGQFDLDPLILKAIEKLTYQNTTPIQELAIPLILKGKDLIALAETGSGKTAACAIPICHKVNPDQPDIQALIIVPTREIALQYATATQKIGAFKKVKVFALFGGEDIALQHAKLKGGCQVLIATPGRLIDLIFSRLIDLSKVTIFVLDEADQMLGMGFYEDLEFIINCLIHQHQTLLFSATMPKQIEMIAKNHMIHPEEIILIHNKPTPAKLRHQLTFCSDPRKKQEELVFLLKKFNPTQCLIFANSRREVEALYHYLKSKIPGVDFLHGGLEQKLRCMLVNKFQKGKIRFLIATDIAARGLDFSEVTHVFNLHFPLDKETYTHRAGRTGRSGRTGVCVTLVTKREMPKVKKIFKMLKRDPKWLNPPPVL
ncbi:MAG: DEAD/DEAH box helicase [Chlamydiales bacterium]